MALRQQQQPYDPYYYHQLPQLQQQPQYIHNNNNNIISSSINNSNNNNNHINTLFVAGLPDNVKAREIHNLFRRRPGFDYCQLKFTGRGNQIVAFAIFVNHQSAMAALHEMNGVKFDPQTGHTLHIELARTNSTRIRKPGSGKYVVIDNRNKTERHNKEPRTDDGNSQSDGDTGTNETDDDDSDSATVKSAKEETDHETTGHVENQTEKAASGACSTLFIANLGPNCTEAELEEFVSQYNGFKVLKVRARGGMPVAFADFEGVEQATTAMNALQGISLPSSDRGGLHIEYARSKMRKV